MISVVSAQAFATVIHGVEGMISEITTRASSDTDYCISRVESVMGNIDEVISAYSESDNIQRFSSLRLQLSQLQLSLRNTTATTCSVAAVGCCSTTEVQSSRGRPKIHINVDQVELLRSAGYTWNEVADCFLVSKATIWRRLKEAGVTTQKYSDISDRCSD